MAGGRRRFSKPGVAAAGRTVFVEGGLLNDWQDRRCPPPSSSTSGKPKRHNGGGSAKPRGGGRKDFGPAGRSLKTHQGNAFAYSYPVESGGLVGESSGLQEAAPVFLGGFGEKSAVTVFVDSRPQADPTNEVPSYDYYSVGFVGALSGSLAGLGFHEEGEVEGMEAGEGEAREMVVGFDSSSPISEKNDNKSDAFLSIGGLRLYTEDISSPDGHSGGLDEEEEDDDDDDDDDEDSFEGEDADSVEGSSSGGDKEEDGSEDETSSDDYDDGSDIDEEVMEDYLEGIGGTSELLKAGWLAEDFDKHDLDSSFNGESRNEVMEKLGGAALMNASEEYGMQKPRLKNKKNDRDGRNRGLAIGGSKSIALDDLFVKDCRTYSRKNKKDVPDFSWSWPCQPQTSKMDKRVRGEKKKHRKEMIAKKRRERMHNRGVDLEKINLKLRQMVVDEADILSFQPMHSRDCAQVQRLASIYHLRSGSQGSGKKRFVTVTRTGRTSLPSSSDKLRLEKLLGLGDEYYSIDNHDKTAKNPAQMQSQIKVAKQMRASVSYHRRGVHHSASGMLMKSSANPSRNIREGGTKATGKQSGRSLYADNPVSFVSCGMMQVDPSAALAIDSMENSVSEKNLGNSHAMLQEAAATAAEGSSKVGAFELHTKGFGSRMMTKMGFTEGSGLGKDGQGIALPIEAIIRPKSLGLGVQFSMDTQERSGTGKDGDSQKKKQKNQAKSSGTAAQNRQMTLGKRDDSRGIGAFERHTKGFGSKMMAKMGYVPGMGLGREAQGIAAPLAAVKLPKSLGLGASV